MKLWFRLLGIISLSLLTLVGSVWTPERISAEDSTEFVAFQEDTKKGDPKKDLDTKKGDPKKDLDTKKGDPKKDLDTKKSDPKKEMEKKKETDSKKDAGSEGTVKKKVTNSKKEKPEVPKNPYVKINTIAGKVSKYDEGSNCLTMKVPMPYFNGKKYESKEVDLKAILTDDVKIRVLNPPPKFDDKGRPKKYTAKELIELKGEDKRALGYPGDTEELQPNAFVKVELVRTKEDYAKLKRNKKDDPASELASTNLIIVISPPPPSP